LIAQIILFDIAPDPVGKGLLLSVVLLVIGFIALLAVGLVVFLWYRKRSLRGVAMIRPDSPPAEPAQTSKPNQP
jgi:flagellar basal body-associated protein FliL